MRPNIGIRPVTDGRCATYGKDLKSKPYLWQKPRPISPVKVRLRTYIGKPWVQITASQSTVTSDWIL